MPDQAAHPEWAQQAAADPLLQPLTVKGFTFKNRIMSTAHAPGYAEAGLPGERYQLYHEEKARGGLALTMFGGNSMVSADAPNALLYDTLSPLAANRGVTDLALLAAGQAQPVQPDRFTLWRVGDAVVHRGIHAAILDARRLCQNV